MTADFTSPPFFPFFRVNRKGSKLIHVQLFRNSGQTSRPEHRLATTGILCLEGEALNGSPFDKGKASSTRGMGRGRECSALTSSIAALCFGKFKFWGKKNLLAFLGSWETLAALCFSSVRKPSRWKAYPHRGWSEQSSPSGGEKTHQALICRCLSKASLPGVATLVVTMPMNGFFPPMICSSLGYGHYPKCPLLSSPRPCFPLQGRSPLQ